MFLGVVLVFGVECGWWLVVGGWWLWLVVGGWWWWLGVVVVVGGWWLVVVVVCVVGGCWLVVGVGGCGWRLVVGCCVSVSDTHLRVHVPGR